MKIDIQKEETVAQLCLRDEAEHGPLELDLTEVPLLAESMANCEADQHVQFILDFQHVSFVDASLLKYLVQKQKSLQAKGGGLILLAPQPAILHLLTITKLQDVIPTATSLPQAFAHFSSTDTNA